MAAIERPPETRYARGEEGHVAYQVFGNGPPDVVFISGWLSNIEVMWESDSAARYFDRLASFSRVICFDKRGTGVSDPVPLAALPTIDHWMDDARVVMDEVGSEQAALIGDTEGGMMAIVFAATYPERTSALVLINSLARILRDDDYPIGAPLEVLDKIAVLYLEQHGTSGNMLELTAPSVADDPAFRHWWTRYQRLAMPPESLSRMYDWVRQVDVTAVLPTVRVPTLVIHRVDNVYHRIQFGRYLAEHIPGAKLVELPEADSLPFHAGDYPAVLDEVQEFLTGARETAPPDRVLATVMFTDIVGSTERAAALGDQRWLELLASHDKVVRDHVRHYRGREVTTTGDGFLATFDGPTRAVMCATDTRDAVRSLGMDIRAGLHTGEVERRNGDIAGIAVHVAARVTSSAAGGSVVVSSTVKDLTAGSGITFTDRGVHELEGVPGSWPLFEVMRVR